MTLEEFVTKWLGKKADFDGVYSGQCVDLYRFYVKEVLGFPQSPGVGGAAEIWDTVDPKYYDKILNDPNNIPLRGDIVIWNRKAGGGFGHVAIFLVGDVNKFTSLDQNWPTLDKVTQTQHDYANVIGWLRPKTIKPDSEEVAQLKQEILEKNKQISNYDEQVKGLVIEVKAEKEKYTRDVQFLADKLKTSDDITEMGKAIDNLLVKEDGLMACIDDKQSLTETYTSLQNEFNQTLEILSKLCGITVASHKGIERALQAYLKLHPQEIVGDIKDFQNIIKLGGHIWLKS